MDATSRNRVLMIGGALILIALLLVCGPLTGRFGESTKQEPPSVAAGPPEVDADVAADEAAEAAAALAAAGATAGAAVGESGIGDAGAGARDGLEGEEDGIGGPIEAGGLAAAGAVAGAAATADGGKSNASKSASSKTASAPRTPKASPKAAPLPPVSAGVPVAAAAAATGAAAAASAFDDSFAAASRDSLADGTGAAGKVVDRFAPPVAGAASGGLAMADLAGLRKGRVLRACDSPGAGCSNTGAGQGPANPPITPGVRPVPGGTN